MAVDLGTTYLGLKLRSPIVASASPLTDRIDFLERLDEAGAGAAVLPSLFQEQIEHDELEITRFYDYGAESFGEALDYFPEMGTYNAGPDSYLRSIEAAKAAVSMPIIASLNGKSKGGWERYAQLIEAQRRRRARAEHSRRGNGRQRRLRRIRTTGHRSDYRRAGRDLDSAGGEDRALFFRAGQFRAAGGRSRCRRPRAVQPLPSSRSRPRDDADDARVGVEPAPRTAPGAAVGRHSLRTDEGIAGGQRRNSLGESAPSRR